MFHLIFGLPWLYVVSRTVWPMPWGVPVKLAVALLLLTGSQFHLWSRISSGSIFNPEFPRPVVILFNWAFGTIGLLAVMQITLDVIALAAHPFRHGGLGAMVEARYAIGVAAAALSAIGVWQAVRIPSVREVTVAIPNLPTEFEGYTIVQLTDLHISRLFRRAWTADVVAATNKLEPDLIVVTGDVIDGSVAARRSDVEPLRELRAADGIYAIPGNHEYLSGYDEWMAHLKSLGLYELPNANAVIRKGSEQLVIAGVTDPSARGANRPLPDLDLALKGAPARAPIILLDHEPRKAPEAAARGVALQLSGHTHGGMILGLDRLVARANGGFVSGRYVVGSMTLYVNNGTGIWPGFALRIGRPSELTRFKLVS